MSASHHPHPVSYGVVFEDGKPYFWCALNQKQPFRDNTYD